MKRWSFVVGYLCVFAPLIRSPAKMCKDWFDYKSRTKDQVHYHKQEYDFMNKAKSEKLIRKDGVTSVISKENDSYSYEWKWNMRATTSRDDYDMLLQNHNQKEFRRIYTLHPSSTVRSMIRCVSIRRFSLSSTVLEERLLEIQLILPPSLTQVLQENYSC